jgi:uncharacterized protein YkwD
MIPSVGLHRVARGTKEKVMNAMDRSLRKLALVLVAVSAAFAVLGASVASADDSDGPWRFQYPLVGAASCPSIDAVVLPSDAAGAIMSRVYVERAVLCLVNAERAAHGVAPLKRYVALRGSRTPALNRAAYQAASEAVASPWWGTYDEQGNMRSPHVNPFTGSTVESRIFDTAGYCAPPYAYRAIGENAFVGTGTVSTARAAVSWWMTSTLGHREAILNPQFTETSIAAVYGSAAPDLASYGPAATYIQVFGTCAR